MKDNRIYSKEQNLRMKQIIEDWFNKKIKPNFFVTIQFPKYMRRRKLDLAYKKLYEIMYHFERNIHGRHWNKHKTPFISFAENGIATTFHFHLYFYNNDISPYKIRRIFKKVSYELRLPKETICVKKVRTVNVYSYGAKELFIDKNGDFDPYRIIETELLFALYKRQPKKAPVSIKLVHTPHYDLEHLPRITYRKLNKLCGYHKKRPVKQSDTITYHRKRVRIYIPD